VLSVTVWSLCWTALICLMITLFGRKGNLDVKRLKHTLTETKRAASTCCIDFCVDNVADCVDVLMIVLMYWGAKVDTFAILKIWGAFAWIEVLVCWSVMLMSWCRSVEVLKYWCVEVLMCWSLDVLSTCWSVEVLKCWSVEVFGNFEPLRPLRDEVPVPPSYLPVVHWGLAFKS